jgi:hypothetical protein
MPSAAPLTPAPGPDVFVSHAGPNKALAEQLRGVLSAQLKLEVFLDKCMPPGGAADEAMLSAARGAHVGLALFSREFAEREWPLRELGIFAASRSLVPALVPPLSYEGWKECLSKASVTDDVRAAALRTTMVVVRDASELLTWQQKVCLAVVRALVAKAKRSDLPNLAWVGAFRSRVKAAAQTMCDSKHLTTHLTMGEMDDLREESGALVVNPWGHARP